MSFNYGDYWREHGDRVRQRRNERYKNDPDYAEKQRKWSADYRQKRKSVSAKRGTRPRRSNLRCPVHIEVHGPQGTMRIVCWSVGSLASAIGRPKGVVNQWEASGFIPLTPLRDDGGSRLYTMQMIDALKRAVSARKRLRSADRIFYYEVLWAWNNCGLPAIRDGQVRQIGAVTELPLPHSAGMLLTLHGFADAIGKSVGTVLNWERNGVLPETPLRYGGKRFYPRELVSKVRQIVEGALTVRYTDDGIVAQIRECWEFEFERLRRMGVERLV